jgi:hypothetical protein
VQHSSLVLQVLNVLFNNNTENIIYVIVKEYTFLKSIFNDGNASNCGNPGNTEAPCIIVYYQLV